MTSRIDRTLSSIDVGLQESSEHGTNVGVGCFRCSKANTPLNAIDLCRDCEAWLHADMTVAPPADATLHASISDLPDEPPPFGDSEVPDWFWRLCDDQEERARQWRDHRLAYDAYVAGDASPLDEVRAAVIAEMIDGEGAFNLNGILSTPPLDNRPIEYGFWTGPWMYPSWPRNDAIHWTHLTIS